MDKIHPSDIYDYLPHTNCKRCGEDNCFAFAVQLANRASKVCRCGPLRLKEQEKNLKAIINLLGDEE